MAWLERTEEYFRDLYLRNLWVDQAYLNVSNGRDSSYYLYSLASNCVRCPFRKMRDIDPNNDSVIVVNTARSLQMRLFSKNHGQYVFPNQSEDGLLWNDEPKMGQFGVYDLILDASGTNRFEVALDPVPIYWCNKRIIFYFYNSCLIKKSIFKFRQHSC